MRVCLKVFRNSGHCIARIFPAHCDKLRENQVIYIKRDLVCITGKTWIKNIKTKIKYYTLRKMFHSIVNETEFEAFSLRSR